eukprot:CAMPEP_0183563980 /NCGR_PEP_ID=MMETSP0371-20130417/103784_1 /TAXON_ID=268820 /ORGANISM="Peridinium aciculiferum, Strain PAER-2" /LENGTH=222 /DNA_ID=CAMNT_0025772927 /DNA_START=111 /DNA_END=775 /DNA_ORIENTATION=+
MARHAQLHQDRVLEVLIVGLVLIELFPLRRDFRFHVLREVVVAIAIRLDVAMQVRQDLVEVVIRICEVLDASVDARRQDPMIIDERPLGQPGLHVGPRFRPIGILLGPQVLEGQLQAVVVRLLLRLIPCHDAPQLSQFVFQPCDLRLAVKMLSAQVFTQPDDISLHRLHDAEGRVEGMLGSPVMRRFRGPRSATGARRPSMSDEWQRRPSSRGRHRNTRRVG